jgi:hypothetical protein
VTIPSQQRYIQYYEKLLQLTSSEKGALDVCHPPEISLRSIEFRGTISSNEDLNQLQFVIINKSRCFTSECVNKVNRLQHSKSLPCNDYSTVTTNNSATQNNTTTTTTNHQGNEHVKFDPEIVIQGDVRFEVFSKLKFPIKKNRKKLFQACFNTMFVSHFENIGKEEEEQNNAVCAVVR